MGKINEYLEKNYKKYKNDIGIVYKENEKYINVTNKEIYQYVNSLVFELNNKRYDNVAIIGGNKLEWMISFWAVMGYIGDVIVIDKELEKDSILKMFEIVKPNLIIIDDELNLKFEDYECLYFSDINKLMKEKVKIILNNEHTGNLYLHTSGTTGEQKLIKLNENNLCGAIPELNKKWDVTHKESCFYVIPLYHIYALATIFHCMYAGVSIILETDYKKIDIALKETKPTIFLGVPLMYNKIKDKIMSRNPFFIKMMIAISNILRIIKIDIRKKIFKEIHNYFGGMFYFGCSAGSLLSYETNKFFNDIGLPIYNVYGMTETSGPVAINYKDNNDYNSVGRILDANIVKIVNKNKDGVRRDMGKRSKCF